MKNNILLLGILLLTLTGALVSTFTAGEQHVITVENNLHLVKANDSLVTENTRLETENGSLKEQNKQLTHKIEIDSIVKTVDVKKDEAAEAAYKIALLSLEKIVKEDLTWISPEAAYEAMADQLNRKPSKDEYTNTLRDLMIKNMLYHSSYPDPYIKGKKVKESEIKLLVDELTK